LNTIQRDLRAYYNLTADVYIWRYELLVVHERKKEGNLVDSN